MRSNFLEGADIVSAFVPVDMQTAANNGDWVNLSRWGRCVAVLFKAAGTAGDDPVFTLKQATNAAGDNPKDLKFTTIWKKVGTQTAIDAFTKTAQTLAATHTDLVSAEAQGIFAVEIQAADLDSAGGFTHMQLSVPDVGGNAQLGCGFYIMLDPLYGGVSTPSAIE
jgi:hypothetical protein